MDGFLEYIAELVKCQEAGQLADFADPGDPDDIDEALTQEEINFVKRLKKEVEERFVPPVEP